MADDENPKHVIYGSAGMAAAGMIPGSATSRAKSEEQPVEGAANEEDASIADESLEDTQSEAGSEEFEHPVPEPTEVAAPAFGGKYAVVIGHTGAGDFGDGLDRIFQRLDGVRLAALTDCNEETYEDTATNAAAPRGFSSYSAMLEREENADLCCVAPSWTEQRFEMIQSALNADCHVICGLPFTQTLKEADELLKQGREKGRLIAVTDFFRCDPLLSRFHAGSEALIGDLLEMHVYGAMGNQAGGEDMIANALPLFDLVRWFGGEPEFASATVSKQGYPAIPEDAHELKSRNLGRLLGDSIHAQFLLESGVRVTFTSDAQMQNIAGRAGIRFVGKEATMRLYTNPEIEFSIQFESRPNQAERSDPWTSWPAGTGRESAETETAPNRDIVLDWISAIEEKRDPLCSAENATKALEMAHAIWQSAITLKRAYFPLPNRLHPLADESH